MEIHPGYSPPSSGGAPSATLCVSAGSCNDSQAVRGAKLIGITGSASASILRDMQNIVTAYSTLAPPVQPHHTTRLGQFRLDCDCAPSWASPAYSPRCLGGRSSRPWRPHTRTSSVVSPSGVRRARNRMFAECCLDGYEGDAQEYPVSPTRLRGLRRRRGTPRCVP
jgi:hypothetical protein